MPAHSLSAAKAAPETPLLKKLKNEAYQLNQAGQFRPAIAAYEAAYNQALADGNIGAAIRELNNLASVRISIFSYQDGLRAYLEAKKLAEHSGRTEVVPIINANLSLLYLAMGDYAQAIQLGESTIPALNGELKPYRAHLLNNLGVAYASSGDFVRGQSCFRRAGDEAESAGNIRMKAAAFDRLGSSTLEQGQLVDAEAYLFEAFRLRTLGAKGDLYLSYPRIGKLFAAKGMLPEARRFYDLAVASQTVDPKLFPYYAILADRASVRLQSGDEAGALEDFRAALVSARRQRLEVLPVGSMQASWEGVVHKLRSSFIRFTAERAIRTQDSALALEALVAAEESRLASVRSSDGIPKWQAKLPPEYWEKLAALQKAEANRDSGPEMGRIRLALIEMEARAGLEAGWITLPSQPLAQARRVLDSLPANEAVISFYLDEPNSYVWFIVRGNLHLAKLPARRDISAKIAAFREAVEHDSSDLSALGRGLYSALFGDTPPAVASKALWTVVSDDRLFELPFAALPVDGGQPEVFLIEKHALRGVPSIFLTAREEHATSGLFVGIGDPIYNAADPRLEHLGRNPKVRPVSVELPRLVSSGTEIDLCARAWGGSSRLYKGADVTADNVENALRQSPAVMHFATHFIYSAENRERAMIVLGLNSKSREPQLMGSDQIAALRLTGGIVTMSGCHSGAGETIPGAGLMGLTRSWLIAGAQAVTGTYWPTPDDSGDLFAHLYRVYVAQSEASPQGAAIALQQAQVAMIRSNGWRHSPKYWGAFFLITRGLATRG